MTKRTRSPNRTVDQILAEQLAKVEALKQRAALEAAKLNPALTPLITAIKSANTALISDSKLLGEGPQSTQTRRRSHELWINVIDAEERKAELNIAYLKRDRDTLNDLLASLSSDIADGKDITEDDVQGIMENSRPSPGSDLQEAKDTFDRVCAERENHTAQKAMRKRSDTVVATISVEG